METFRVLVQQMDYEYRVTVEGAANAAWLIGELSRAFIFKSALHMASDREMALHSFQVPLTALLPLAAFRRILSAMPSVRLTMVPAVA